MLNARRRRPSLIGTAARTAVIAGTATAVSSSVSRSSQQAAQQKAAAQQAQVDEAVQQALVSQPTDATRGQSDTKIEQLQKLAELKQAGVLSDEEFESMKAEVLAG